MAFLPLFVSFCMMKKFHITHQDVFFKLNVEALSSDEASQSFFWSSERDCSESNGSYRACEANGTGNSCSEGGSVTCTCGKNCD